MGLQFTAIPSPSLNKFLNNKKITNTIFIMEQEPISKINLPVKSTLNSISGIYLCVNLINNKFYVGSDSLKHMYRRYSAHLLGGKGGSILVNRAVKKYGLENFAFIVIDATNQQNISHLRNTSSPCPRKGEVISAGDLFSISKLKSKENLLKLEQKYMDLLLPEYNLAKIAGSVLNTK